MTPSNRYAFRTRDGLTMIEECPDLSDSPQQILRPLKPVAGMAAKFTEYRKYLRTSDTFNGRVVFEEVL